jgi:hypothetical protein
MGRRRRRSRRQESRSTLYSRRGLLVALGGAGLSIGAIKSGAFATGEVGRSSDLTTAADSNATVGLVITDPVQEGTRQSLVDITNNRNDTLTYTVSLSDCTQGLLYSPSGSGCSVTITLASGNTGTVDIKPQSIAGGGETVNFSISADTTGFSFDTTRSTTAKANNANAVTIKRLDTFTANGSTDDWSIKQIKIQDSDGDNDLDRVEYTIQNESGTAVATRTDNASGNQYQQQNVTIQPDQPGYSLVPCETYTLTVVGFDVDGNSTTASRADLVPPQNSPITIKNISGFSARTSTDDWFFKQVQIQDNNKDLDRVEYEILEINGTTVATRTDTATGNQYQQQKFSIAPDDASYTVKSGLKYIAAVSAYDQAGNKICGTRTATA